MPETIESFVNKLQTEGVEAGQAAADKIRTEAQQQAEQIIKTAQQQADAIITDAKDQAQANLDRNAAELKLAARDTLLRLRGTLSKILQTVLTKRTESQLADPDFLKSLIQEVVTQYARADSTGVQDITINLSEEHRRQLLTRDNLRTGRQREPLDRPLEPGFGVVQMPRSQEHAPGSQVRVEPNRVDDHEQEHQHPRRSDQQHRPPTLGFGQSRRPDDGHDQQPDARHLQQRDQAELPFERADPFLQSIGAHSGYPVAGYRSATGASSPNRPSSSSGRTSRVASRQ